jgi:Anthrone oxygenase
MIKKVILFASIICASGLTMVSIYNTVIDAQSWASDIPASIQTARDYFRYVDPRRFFTVAGPINEILILLTLIVFWKDSVTMRLYFATSAVLYAAIVILTLSYFVPRDLILFTWSIPDHIEQIRAAAADWRHMNWLRSLLGLIGVLSSFKGSTFITGLEVQKPNVYESIRTAIDLFLSFWRVVFSSSRPK